MPCYDSRDDEDREDRIHMAQGGELLCRLLTEVGFSQFSNDLDGYNLATMSRIKSWWHHHVRRDAERMEIERKMNRGGASRRLGWATRLASAIKKEAKS